MSAAFSPAERRLLRWLVIATAAGTCWHTCRDLRPPPPPVEVLRGALAPDSTGIPPPHGGSGRDLFPLDLATADSAALTALPGIGPVLAGRITAWRRERGGITEPDELLDVAGIGRVLMDRLRPLVRVGADPSAGSPDSLAYVPPGDGEWR
jgi:hypothetical protein